MGLRLSNRQLFLYGLVIILIGAALGSISLTYPFGRDQAFYAYAGKLLLEGKMNYLYVFDLKPPGSHLFFALSDFLLGSSMFSFRIFDMIWQISTAFVIFLLAFKLTGKKSLSVISSLLYILLYYRLDYWHTMQADGMLNLPFTISILLLISSFYDHSFVKIFFAGILFALAVLFKYTIISFLPLVIFSFLLSKNELSSIRIKNSLIYIAGLILITGIIALWYQYAGALKDLVDIQFGQTSQYTKIAYDTETGEFIISSLIRLFTYSVYSPLIWFSILGSVILIFKRKNTFPNLIILSWVLSSLFSLIIQWKFYHYHFLVIIASISVGTAVFVSYLLNDLLKLHSKKVIYVLTLLLIGFIVYAGKPYLNNYQTLFSYLSGKETLKEVYIKNGITTDSVFMIRKTFNAIDYVNQNTNINDNIYVWGYDPLVYYMTNRKCVSRFVYHIPLLWKAENTGFRNEFISELHKTKPKLIIIASNDPLFYISGYNEDSKQLLERFTEFKKILENDYVFKKRIDDYDFYELKSW